MRKKLRILFLEDVPSDATLVQHELRKAGLAAQIKRVDSKRAFLAQLKRHPPDLILSDHGLPSFDGISALALTREKCPGLPFIFVTDFSGRTTESAARRQGATSYVSKRKLAKLAPAICRALRKPAVSKAECDTSSSHTAQGFRLLVQGIKECAILRLNPEGKIAFWNSGASDIYGYSAEEMIGQNFGLLYQDTEVAEGRPQQALEFAKRHGRFQEEAACITKARQLTRVHTAITAIKLPGRKLWGFAHVSQSLTERHQAQAALRQSEESFRLLVESVTDYAIYMLDAEGRVATWNAGAERMEGYAASEIIGQHLSTFYPPEDVQAKVPDQVLERALVAGHALNEGWRIRKDGTRFWTRGVVTALRNEEGKLQGFAKIAHDRTRQKQDEEEIRHLNATLEHRVIERTAQLEAANQELEAFSYSVSHDLRSPLRHITGYADILQAEAAGSLNETSRHHLETIVESATKMERLIDALLSFSRMGRTELRRANVPLGSLVEQARRELREESRGRKIEWRIAELPTVRGDSTLLRQVVLNLLSNSLKYTRNRNPARIEIGCDETEDEIVVFVRDNGVGFDMRYADKLFGVFQRLHSSNQFEGTGIGLANVRRVIHRHGGRTWATSKVNAGATFYFSLPKLPKGTA